MRSVCHGTPLRGEAEPGGERVRDGRAVRVRGGERAGRAAVLHGQRVEHLDEPGAGTVQAGAPGRGDGAERRRQRLLAERARGRRGVAVAGGEVRGGVRRTGQVLDDPRDRPDG